MREITVGVVAPAYVNVPLWVAQQRGFLERRGLRVSEQILGSTHGVTSALRGGVVDIALTWPEGSIADAVAGGPLRVVVGLIDRPPLSMIAIPRHRTFGDLRGGQVGTSSLTEGTCVRRPAQRSVVTPFLAALAEAVDWFRGHTEESAALAAAQTSVEPRYALRACQTLARHGVIPRDLRSTSGALAAVTGALRSSGLIPPEEPDPAAMAVDHSYLR